MLNRVSTTLPPFLKPILVVSLLGITWTAHAQTVEFREITYAPLGNATLNLVGSPETGVLSVENIGVSGLDGVAAELPDVCFYRARWEALPTPNVGDLLRFLVRGPLDELPDQDLGSVRFERTGAGLNLAVDLVPGDAQLNQVVIRNGFSLEYIGVIADLGIVATMATWPREMTLESACSDAISASLRFSWDNPILVSVAGGPVVSGDALTISSGAFTSEFSAVHMEAAGISPIVIADAFSQIRDVGTAVEGPRFSPLALFASVPNPFNPRTEIQFWLARPGQVQLSLYDAQGRFVKTLLSDHRDAGQGSVIWDGTDARGKDVGSGVYLANLTSGGEFRSQKLTLVR